MKNHPRKNEAKAAATAAVERARLTSRIYVLHRYQFDERNLALIYAAVPFMRR